MSLQDPVIRNKLQEFSRKHSPVYRNIRRPSCYQNSLKTEFLFRGKETEKCFSDRKTPTRKPLQPDSVWRSEVSLHPSRPSSTRSRVPSGNSSRSTLLLQSQMSLAPKPSRRLLLRRPYTYLLEPLRKNEDYFHHLASGINLKSLPFSRNADAFKFYQTHYPLILTRVQTDADRPSTPSRGRSKTPDYAVNTVASRKMILNDRVMRLDLMLEDLERKTEDCLFVTELRDPVYNPQEYPWNLNIDTASLRRRYTIDATLKELYGKDN